MGDERLEAEPGIDARAAEEELSRVDGLEQDIEGAREDLAEAERAGDTLGAADARDREREAVTEVKRLVAAHRPHDEP
jgi:hypothetical protein